MKKPTGRETCGLCCMLGSNRNLMPRLEFKCQPSIPMDDDNVYDREPEPVIELGDGVAVLCQLEHEAADILGLSFTLCLHRLEIFQLGLGGFVPLCQAIVAFQIGGLISLSREPVSVSAACMVRHSSISRFLSATSVLKASKNRALISSSVRCGG